jgi:hypothetical protein
MKCAVAFSILLGGCSMLLGDSPSSPSSSRHPASTLLDDLVRMTRAGSSDASVLAYAKAHRMELPPELSDASLRWLRDSRVSETVVRYMAAIDVRASDVGAPEGVTDASGEDERAARPRAAYSSESDSGNVPPLYAESDAGASGYPYRDSDTYAGYEYDYGYGYYPSFGDPYAYSPFSAYFFVDRGRSFRRFPRRDRRDHRFDGGHRGDRGGFRDAWRERGSPRRRGSMVAGPRGSGRPAFARGGVSPSARGPHGHAIGHRGFGPPGPGRGGFPNRFRGSPGGAGVHRDFGHAGFSHGPPGGRSFSRGPIGMSGGGRGRR